MAVSRKEARFVTHERRRSVKGSLSCSRRKYGKIRADGGEKLFHFLSPPFYTRAIFYQEGGYLNSGTEAEEKNAFSLSAGRECKSFLFL